MPLDGWIRYDDTGLKGTTAVWARANIDDALLPCVTRHVAHDAGVVAAQLARCSKAVAAVGFERRALAVSGADVDAYDRTTGRIGTDGLYGVGIAFPESLPNREGEVESRVGLWKFMQYFQRIVPLWLAD